MLPHWLIETLSQRLVADAYTPGNKAACAYFVAAIHHTNSNQFDRSDKILSQRQRFSHVTRGDLLQQPVAATCCSDLSHCVSWP